MSGYRRTANNFNKTLVVCCIRLYKGFFSQYFGIVSFLTGIVSLKAYINENIKTAITVDIQIAVQPKTPFGAKTKTKSSTLYVPKMP